MNVYLGNTIAGATWLPPWRALCAERPELAREVEIVWQTEPVHKDVPQELVKQISKLLFELHHHKHGRKILEGIELSKFEPATDKTYQPVVEFLEKYNRLFRANEHQ